jgi:hypothetical protein
MLLFGCRINLAVFPALQKLFCKRREHLSFASNKCLQVPAVKFVVRILLELVVEANVTALRSCVKIFEVNGLFYEVSFFKCAENIDKVFSGRLETSKVFKTFEV